mmetsp:Transcript_4574/g.9149  ORF Transcript_4574/g.9149 Transcript_4574/m.9149 type:complete len:84 (-) Transcript_4574:1812-2063(-)
MDLLSSAREITFEVGQYLRDNPAVDPDVPPQCYIDSIKTDSLEMVIKARLVAETSDPGNNKYKQSLLLDVAGILRKYHATDTS